MNLAIGGLIVIMLSLASQAPAAMDVKEMSRALDAFERALDERWSYLRPSEFDHQRMSTALRTQIDQGIAPDGFILELQRIIGSGIDGHATIDGWERVLPGGYLPFLIEPAGARFVAFNSDRSGFVDDEHPFIESLDGKPVAAWIEAASASCRTGRRSTCVATGSG